MRHQQLTNLHPGERVEQISLIKYSKTACGVDFLLNTAESREKRGWFDTAKRYKTDFFEFYLFRKASGHLFLRGKRIELHDQMALIISPYQQQEWHVTIDDLDYTFLIFQEEFINNFLSDKYFMYRLLYCYQNELPTCFDMTTEEMAPFHELSRKMRHELLEPIADSYHMVALLAAPKQLCLSIQTPAGKEYPSQEPGERLCGDDRHQPDIAQQGGRAGIWRHRHSPAQAQAPARDQGPSSFHRPADKGDRLPTQLLGTQSPGPLLQATDRRDHQRVHRLHQTVKKDTRFKLFFYINASFIYIIMCNLEDKVDLL